jgi:hypothetical protein
LHEDHPCEDDEEAEQFKQDEEVSHADYPVAMVHEKENMPTLKSSKSSGSSGIVVGELCFGRWMVMMSGGTRGWRDDALKGIGS